MKLTNVLVSQNVMLVMSFHYAFSEHIDKLEASVNKNYLSYKYKRAAVR